MNPELAKRQMIRVAVVEILMVIAVVALASVLILVVSGYSLNENLEISRSGLLQVSSVPTGANVMVDGKMWFSRTNTSKILSSGRHSVEISKEGYDSWTKTIEVADGLLYRLHYPRLFLQERTKEMVLETSGITFSRVSPKHSLLLVREGGDEWGLVRLDKDKITKQRLAIGQVGEVLGVEWSGDENRVLMKVRQEGKINWLLVDLATTKKVFDLSSEFGVAMDEVRILDGAGSSLLATVAGGLRKIDVAGRTMSNVLAEKVKRFSYHENDVMMVLGEQETGYALGHLKLGEGELKRIRETEANTEVALVRFYNEKYLVTVAGKKLEVYRQGEVVLAKELSFAPDGIEVGKKGEFVLMGMGAKIAALDMESMNVTEWGVSGEKVGWLDNNMLYTVLEGELIVYDFDGLNRRQLVKNVSAQFPVMITENKWLYYFSDGKLMREWLVPK